MSYRNWSIRRIVASPPYVRVIVVGLVEAGVGALQPEDALDDRAGDQEEQDRRLEDVDELDRDAGLDLHRGRRRCASPRRAARRATIPIGFARPSSATAIASKPTVVPYDGGHRGGSSPRSSVAPASPASSPDRDIVQMIRRRGDIPA